MPKYSVRGNPDLDIHCDAKTSMWCSVTLAALAGAWAGRSDCHCNALTFRPNLAGIRH